MDVLVNTGNGKLPAPAAGSGIVRRVPGTGKTESVRQEGDRNLKGRPGYVQLVPTPARVLIEQLINQPRVASVHGESFEFVEHRHQRGHARISDQLDVGVVLAGMFKRDSHIDPRVDISGRIAMGSTRSHVESGSRMENTDTEGVVGAPRSRRPRAGSQSDPMLNLGFSVGLEPFQNLGEIELVAAG